MSVLSEVMRDSLRDMVDPRAWTRGLPLDHGPVPAADYLPAALRAALPWPPAMPSRREGSVAMTRTL